MRYISSEKPIKLAGLYFYHKLENALFEDKIYANFDCIKKGCRFYSFLKHEPVIHKSVVYKLWFGCGA